MRFVSVVCVVLGLVIGGCAKPAVKHPVQRKQVFKRAPGTCAVSKRSKSPNAMVMIFHDCPRKGFSMVGIALIGDDAESGQAESAEMIIRLLGFVPRLAPLGMIPSEFTRMYLFLVVGKAVKLKDLP
jgi:hypothetical protein